MLLTSVTASRGTLKPTWSKNAASSAAMTRVAQHVRDVVVLDDHPALGGELTDDLAAAIVYARDGFGGVVIQLGDDRQIRRVGKNDAARGARQRAERHDGDDQRVSDQVSDWSGHLLLGAAPQTPGGRSRGPIAPLRCRRAALCAAWGRAHLCRRPRSDSTVLGVPPGLLTPREPLVPRCARLGDGRICVVVPALIPPFGALRQGLSPRASPSCRAVRGLGTGASVSSSPL